MVLGVLHKPKTFGVKVHVAKICEIFLVKEAELDDKDIRNIFKGRAVLDGSWVKDENSVFALFNDMGSSPASKQDGKGRRRLRAATRIRY